MNYHIATKQSKATAGEIQEDFHSFWFLREYKRKEFGAQRGSDAQKFDFTQLIGDVEDNRLEE